MPSSLFYSSVFKRESLGQINGWPMSIIASLQPPLLPSPLLFFKKIFLLLFPFPFPFIFSIQLLASELVFLPLNKRTTWTTLHVNGHVIECNHFQLTRQWRFDQLEPLHSPTGRILTCSFQTGNQSSSDVSSYCTFIEIWLINAACNASWTTDRYTSKSCFDLASNCVDLTTGLSIITVVYPQMRSII